MAWRDQWATVLWVIWGPTPWAREDVVETLGPLLRPYFISTQYPRLKTATPKSKLDENDEPLFTSGPLKGQVFQGIMDPDTFELVDVGGPYLTGVKWNVRDKDGRKLTAKRMGEIRVAMRTGEVSTRGIQRALREGSERWETLKWGIMPYGKLIAGDVGFPETPALPAKPAEVVVDEPVARKGSIWPWIAGAAAAAGTLAAVTAGGRNA